MEPAEGCRKQTVFVHCHTIDLGSQTEGDEDWNEPSVNRIQVSVSHYGSFQLIGLRGPRNYPIGIVSYVHLRSRRVLWFGFHSIHDRCRQDFVDAGSASGQIAPVEIG